AAAGDRRRGAALLLSAFQARTPDPRRMKLHIESAEEGLAHGPVDLGADALAAVMKTRVDSLAEADAVFPPRDHDVELEPALEGAQPLSVAGTLSRVDRDAAAALERERGARQVRRGAGHFARYLGREHLVDAVGHPHGHGTGLLTHEVDAVLGHQHAHRRQLAARDRSDHFAALQEATREGTIVEGDEGAACGTADGQRVDLRLDLGDLRGGGAYLLAHQVDLYPLPLLLQPRAHGVVLGAQLGKLGVEPRQCRLELEAGTHDQRLAGGDRVAGFHQYLLNEPLAVHRSE